MVFERETSANGRDILVDYLKLLTLISGDLLVSTEGIGCEVNFHRELCREFNIVITRGQYFWGHKLLIHLVNGIVCSKNISFGNDYWFDQL